MTEYIERKALRDALYDADAITMGGVRIINQFHAADVAPVVHGRWSESYLVGIDDIKGRNCSECGYTIGELPSNYCPNCGAKMDLKEEK